MANFDAKIRVLLEAQAAYKEIAKIEKRLKQAVQGPKTLSQTVREKKRAQRAAEGQLKNAVALEAATELYERRLREAARAGTFESKTRAKAVENAKKVAEANKDNVRVLNKVNTLLDV